MKIIAHIDFDAFFASVEELDNPQWQGKPIVVGSDPKNGSGRGVVSTANYKAREYGIHSAMPITKAWLLSETAKKKGGTPTIFLPASMERYAEISEKIFHLISNEVREIEQASIDEAYFDLSFLETFENAKKFCEELKSKIRSKIKITASIGIAPNKLIAKIASDMKKPDGLTLVTNKEIPNFLKNLSVRVLPGIGPKTEKILLDMKIKKISELLKISQEQLNKKFGKWGSSLWEKSRGIDNSAIVTSHIAKSISEEETFEKDSLEPLFIIKTINELAEQVYKRFKDSKFNTYKTVGIRVRLSDFSTKTRAYTLPKQAKTKEILKRESIRLLLPFLDKRDNPALKKIRLIGVRIEKLA